MTEFGSTVAMIPCCICGVPIEPNPSNMCLACLRTQSNFSNEIPNTSSITYCRTCGRYQTSPTQWQAFPLESNELLQLCISKVSGLQNFTKTEAHFLYTEPHSKKLKISLTVQKESINGAILRQTLILTINVCNMQCPQCCEAATPRDHWIANVQLRMDSKHRRTLFWLEQVILSHHAHSKAVNIQRQKSGVDFHFSDKSSAMSFVNFIQNHLPVLVEDSHRQVGEDIQNSTIDSRYSISVRAPPLNRQDLVILPDYLVKGTGNQCFIAVVLRITRNIKMIDPHTAKIIDIDGPKYWKRPFNAILSLSDLKKFVVISIECIGAKIGRFQVADIELVDEETYSEHISVRSHLGNILHENDVVLGYDIRSSVLTDKDAEVFQRHNLSEVIIVGKSVEHKKRNKRRQWHVKELAPVNESDQEEFEEFLDDLENDAENRQNVDIYRNTEVAADDPDVVRTTIALSEMKN
ncbi:60S ribosomal export protein nmd3 [Histomonas meleagridis]|uniref:60S ribosomal export protein nmd3 n=1 Tax=Histomonas meleagridis TaxID=135588 RepID=UPI00355A8B46|nr:60S ribosomal export protein nmd3 [Histomonas meleagridis]